MKIINRNNYYPNILHFHGQNLQELPKTFNLIYSNTVLESKNIEDLTIYSTWTDENDCCLLKQCRKNGISIKNIIPENYDKKQKWYMPNKITFFLTALKKCKTKYVLFLDGYDVLITHLEDIIEKFLSFNYRIIFNASCNNYPNEYIETINNRAKMGVYRYFNAGCCIGYKDDLIAFYEECLNFINEKNPLNSEQLIMRHALKKYMADSNQRYINIDYKSIIFQSMGKALVTYSNNDTLTIGVNEELVGKTYLITGSEGFIGKELIKRLKNEHCNRIYEIDKKIGTDINDAVTIIKNEKIDFVIHLAAQTSVFNDNLEQIEEDNILGFIRIAIACEETNTKLIYASSSTANEKNITSLYGLSKKFNEDFAKIYAPNAIGVRFHNVYSETPREGTLLWCLLNQEKTILYNNGQNKRHFTYIGDIIDCLLICTTINEPKLINCANPEELTTQSFAEIVKNKYNNVNYELSTEVREKDKIMQQVDETIPTINLQYKSVKDILKKED